MSNSSNTQLNSSRPAHHLHNASEPLPVAGSRLAAADYSPANIERAPSSVLHDDDTDDRLVDTTRTSGSAPTPPADARAATGSSAAGISAPHPASGISGATDSSSENHDGDSGRNAFNSSRPLDVEPVNGPEGGVSIGGEGGNGELPMGHANVGDKLVGKTQKVIGKYTKNTELHEKGELRETGGKAAAKGEARAAHD